MSGMSDAPPTQPESEWGQLHALAMGVHADMTAWIEANADAGDVERRSALHEAVNLGSQALAAIGVLEGLAIDGTDAQIAAQHIRIYRLREAANELLARHPPENTP